MPEAKQRPRRLLFGGLAICLAAAASTGVAWRLGWFSPRPSVLLITLDTTRADHLGCYGADAALTPAIDRLAAEGVLFERATSPAPLTLPVHASLLTGLYPPEHGLVTNARDRLSRHVPTLASLLQDHGYDTGAFVSSFVLHAKFGLDRGFAKYDDDLAGSRAVESLQRKRDGASVVDAALEWLGLPRRNPVFCWVHLYDPHLPYASHEDRFGDLFEGRPYDAEIAYADQQIARLVEYVRSRPELADTLIVVAGDHGEGLGEHVERTHGFTLYESTQRVPLILSLPGRLPPGTRAAQTVSLVDVFPTIADLLGLPPRGPVSGRSLRPAWEAGELSERATFAMTDDPYLQNGWAPLRSLTTGRCRYIRTTRPELYDLVDDPGETHNLIDDRPDVARDLDRQLRDWELQMNERRPDAVTLTEAEKRLLLTIGYGPRPSGENATIDRSALPDVKEMLQFDVETQAAVDLLQSGRAADAAVRLEEVKRRAPRHVASRVYLGEAYEALGQPELSVAAYESALDVKPDHVDAWIHLATLCVAEGRLKQAEDALGAALEINSDSADARYNLGLIYSRQRRFDEARRELGAAILADPFLLNAHAALGNLYAAGGSAAEAEPEFQRELTLNPRSVEAHAGLAAILAATGRSDEAIPHLERAVELAPRSAAAWFNLGLLLAERGAKARAASALRKAAQIDPGCPAQAKLDDLLRRL